MDALETLMLSDRLISFLEKCIDSPDTSIRREANSLYGSLSSIVEMRNELASKKGTQNASS